MSLLLDSIIMTNRDINDGSPRPSNSPPEFLLKQPCRTARESKLLEIYGEAATRIKPQQLDGVELNYPLAKMTGSHNTGSNMRGCWIHMMDFQYTTMFIV